MSNQGVLVQMFAGQFIIPPVKSNTMVVGPARKVDSAVKMLILFVAVQFNFVGLMHFSDRLCTSL